MVGEKSDNSIAEDDEITNLLCYLFECNVAINININIFRLNSIKNADRVY